MSPALVFNHHSLPFDSVAQADSAIPEFLRICLRSQRIGYSVILVDESVDSQWFCVRLAGEYFWRDWYRKKRGSAEERDVIRVFLGIATRSFGINDVPEPCLFEVHVPGFQTAFSALRAAVGFEAPLVGFSTRSPWNASPVAVVIERLGTDGVVDTRPGELVNLHSLDVFAIFEADFRKRKEDALGSGRDVLEQWDLLYPLLVLCDRAKGQLASWSHSATVLEQVKASLSALERFSSEWKEDLVPAYSREALRAAGLNHEVSGESETVRNNPDLKKRREFWLPCGRKEVFEDHVKLSGGFRIHMYADVNTRNLYIGYVGPHLPTD